MEVATSRPRVEGDREREIFAATLQLIVETGYDKLTLDAVASRAKASKATLYRRWASKTELVVDAVACLKTETPQLPDTGTLQGDLLAMAECKGLLEPERADVLCGLATAMYRDPELRTRLADRFDDPRQNHLLILLRRARDRGQLRPDVDLDLLSQVIPALVLFQLHFRTPGELPADFVPHVIAEVLLPAVLACPAG
jgi:AcrR family transcriptional regulator